jgi:hypothetical protein
MNSKKGNVFTIEALLGALLFIVFISAISIATTDDKWDGAADSIADDTLIVLNKKGTLKTLNSTFIGNEISQILGNNNTFRLEINTYNYSLGIFENISEISIGSSLPNNKDIRTSEIRFFTTSNESISNYSIARLYTRR